MGSAASRSAASRERDTEGLVERVGRGLHVGVGHVRYSTSTACRPA